MNTSTNLQMTPGGSQQGVRQGLLSMRGPCQPGSSSARGQTLQNTEGYTMTPEVLKMSLAGVASPYNHPDEDDGWYSLDLTNFGGRPVGLAGNYLWSSCYEPDQPPDGRKFRDQLYEISSEKVKFQPAAIRTSKGEILQTQVLQYYCNVKKKNYSYLITLNKAGELKAFILDRNRQMDKKVCLPLVTQDSLVHAFTEFDVDYANKSIYVIGKTAMNHVRAIIVLSYPTQWDEMAVYEISTSLKFNIITLKNGNCFVEPKPNEIIITSINTIIRKAMRIQSHANRWSIQVLPRSQINFADDISTVKGIVNMNPPLMYCQSANSIRFYDTSQSDEYKAPPVYTFHGRRDGKLGDVNSKVIPLPDGSSRVVISHQPSCSQVMVTFEKQDNNKLVGIESNPFNGLMALPLVIKNKKGNRITNEKIETQFCFLAMAFEGENNLLAVLFGHEDTFTVKLYEATLLTLVKELPIVERVNSKDCKLKDLIQASLTINWDFMLADFQFRNAVECQDQDEETRGIMVREFLCSRLMM